jgi:hypothetical protein
VQTHMYRDEGRRDVLKRNAERAGVCNLVMSREPSPELRRGSLKWPVAYLGTSICTRKSERTSERDISNCVVSARLIRPDSSISSA